MQPNKSYRQHSKQLHSLKNTPYHQLSTTLFDHSKTRSLNKKDRQYLGRSVCAFSSQVNRNFPFEPQIHQLPLDLYPQQHHKISKQQIRQRLVEDSRQKINKRLQAKLMKECQQTGNCSFYPTISGFPNNHNNSQQQNNEDQEKNNQLTNIFSKLFNDADQRNKLSKERIRQKRQQQKNNHRQSQQNSRCNYKKLINSQKHHLGPLYTRIMQIVNDRIAHNLQLKQKIQNQKQTIYHPQINEKSKQIFKQKINKQQIKKNVIDRLMDEHRKHSQRIQKLRKDYEQAQNQHLLFKPNINQYLGQSKRKKQNLATKIKQHFQKIGKCSHDDQLYTFQPKINELSDLIVKHIRKQQSPQQKINRLVYDSNQQKQLKLKQIQKQMNAQCLFNPQINNFSHNLNISNCHQHKCEVPEQQIFTYKPTLNQRSRLLRSKSTTQVKKDKDKKLQKYRNQQEYNQLKQCTFRPKINNTRQQGLANIKQVNGVQNYIQRFDKMRKKRQLQSQYEQNLFRLDLKYDQRRYAN